MAAAAVEEAPVVFPREVRHRFESVVEIHSNIESFQDEFTRTFHQNYVLSSQYESLDGDDFYTKYKVRLLPMLNN